ncbi:MAG: 2-amino-4-hydroxy-6-hydroxymethyldihydropteridine diphosphokinase [Sphingobacteriales bacterium]|jgi:2-amino-4-hydroxy-6-hydroxymethyldihydropteridine diphosphokinase
MKKQALTLPINGIILSLGSNLGNKELNINRALNLLNIKGWDILKVSSFFETEPWGNEDQPWFINNIVCAKFSGSPKDAINSIYQIEKELGRIREVHWGERSIDIDIVYWDKVFIKNEILQIPHLNYRNRKFVLLPLKELFPDFFDLEVRKNITQLLGECSDSLICRMA